MLQILNTRSITIRDRPFNIQGGGLENFSATNILFSPVRETNNFFHPQPKTNNFFSEVSGVEKALKNVDDRGVGGWSSQQIFFAWTESKQFFFIRFADKQFIFTNFADKQFIFKIL